MAQPAIDPTFYRTAAEAAAAPGEELAYVVAFDRAAQQHDAMTVIDVNPESETYGRVVGWTDVPGRGDELHHFGWNACSSAIKHEGHDIEGLARRYLLVPGLRSSNVYVLDTGPDSAPAGAGQDDRRRDAVRQGRLLAPAHAALRPRRRGGSAIVVCHGLPRRLAPLNAVRAHQPLDAIATDLDSLAAQRLPRAPVAAGVVVGRVQALDALKQPRLADGACGALAGWRVGSRQTSTRPGPADRLDAEEAAVLVDEAAHFGQSASSSEHRRGLEISFARLSS